MSTVCHGIARKYEDFFNFREGFINIITNASDYYDNIFPTENNTDSIKIIHHGGAMKKRNMELMIKMMRYLDMSKYELTFMLIKHDLKYYEYLKKISGRFTGMVLKLKFFLSLVIIVSYFGI